MTPERKSGDIQIELIPLDFLDEDAPDFATSDINKIEEWFDRLVEEGIMTQEVRDERIAQIEESRGDTSEEKA